MFPLLNQRLRLEWVKDASGDIESPDAARDERTELTARADDLRRRASAGARACAERIERIAQRGAVVSQASMSADETADLRRCVQEYVAALRALDQSPERAVVLVKDLIAEVAPNSVDISRALMDAAVGWTIEAYYSKT